MMKPLLNFLNHSRCQFDMISTIKKLPPDLPLATLLRFLTKNIRLTFNKNYKSSIAKVLSLSQLEQVKQNKEQLVQNPIYVNHDRYRDRLL